jgi:eukaryotic-like serine/threonine-protein kinase
MGNDSPTIEFLPLLAAKERIDRICLAFEAGWKAGSCPRVEDFLGDASGAERADLLNELLLLDLDYRFRLGEQPTVEEYQSRFPNDKNLVRSVFQQEAGPVPIPHPDANIRHFGDYELLEEIGRGGMGVVYKARQKELDRIVALKMILASHLASTEQVGRFQIEARAAAKLRHSNIVQIHEVGQFNGQDFFTMEYIEGKNLGQRIARRPIDQADAVRMIIAVARAVGEAHRQGIVHRDLKPSNILLDAEERPYLTDFGLAKLLLSDTGQTTTKEVLGTMHYMSPEQATGHSRDVKPAADIYSLGAILYQLLTGRPPFVEENLMDLLLALQSGDPLLPRQLNPKIPRALELICLKCLQKVPEERYPSAEALAEDLEHYLRGEPLMVRPPTVTQKFLAVTRRQPALSVRLTGLALFLIVEWTNYEFDLVDRPFHIKATGLLILWMLLSIGCKIFFERGRWVRPARYIWGLSDSLLLLMMLLIGDGVMSPMVIGYPLLIVISGLWFRVGFVWFVTGLSLLSYAALMVVFYCGNPPPQFSGYGRHVVFTVGLAILGGVVAYLCQRVQTLTGLYGQKLP